MEECGFAKEKRDGHVRKALEEVVRKRKNERGREKERERERKRERERHNE